MMSAVAPWPSKPFGSAPLARSRLTAVASPRAAAWASGVSGSYRMQATTDTAATIPTPAALSLIAPPVVVRRSARERRKR